MDWQFGSRFLIYVCKIMPTYLTTVQHWTVYNTIQYLHRMKQTTANCPGMHGAWVNLPPIFVPIRQFFNFTTIFTTNFTTYFTTNFTTNHYHNWGVNIYYHTNFCSNPTIFIFYHIFYHKLLPQTTIIIGESISIFVPIRQFFNFTTHFTTHVTTYFTTNHYHYLHRHPTTFSVPKRNTYKCFERPAKIFIASN